MKRKCSRLAEVQIQSASESISPLLACNGSQKTFLVRLPQGASVVAPAGFDPDELFALLVVLQEASA